MSKYVVGLLFNSALDKVVLIRKKKPAWQKGKLNGPGGSIEEGETAANAMRREFIEETGAYVPASVWSEFLKMSGTDPSQRGFDVTFFCAYGDTAFDVATTIKPHLEESEEIEKWLVDDLLLTRDECIDNIPWVVLLALDHIHDGRPNYVEVHYGEFHGK